MAARDYFYRGPIARRIGDYMQANGGLIAAGDFAKFAAKVGQPVETEYRGYQVYKAGFWTQGPALIETLNMLEGFDLKKMGHNSVAYIHTLAEALKLGMADRDRYYGDPDFVKIPMTELLSKNYAALRRPLIDESRASLAQQPGDPSNMKAVLASAVQTIGRASAIADFGSFTLKGYIAWLAWLFVHLLNLVGFRNRLVVLMQWAWAYFSYQRAIRLITSVPLQGDD